VKKDDPSPCSGVKKATGCHGKKEEKKNIICGPHYQGKYRGIPVVIAAFPICQTCLGFIIRIYMFRVPISEI
jgi:hypothetical protein